MKKKDFTPKNELQSGKRFAKAIIKPCLSTTKKCENKNLRWFYLDEKVRYEQGAKGYLFWNDY